MRVIAGSARSIPLICPEGDGTRPTTDRIKETLFNVIQNDVPGAVFVDLFAGSGACGIEALSRGASKAYFIDNNKQAIAAIEANLKKTRLEDRALVLKQDGVTAITYSIHEDVDVVFMDPPYGKGFDQMVFQAMRDAKCITKDTMIIAEEEAAYDFSYVETLGFSIIKEKIYKSNKHVFFKRKSDES